MANFPIMGIDTAGELFTACTAGGDTFDNTQAGTTLIFRNKNANPRTVVVSAPNTCCFGLNSSAHDLSITIPADTLGTGIYYRVRLDPTRFNNASGMVNMTYSTAVAGLSCAAISYVA